MKTNKSCEKKDMGDLKKDIIHTASTAKEIAQDKLHHVKMVTKGAVMTVDGNVKRAKRKAENSSGAIKKGSHEIAEDVKKTADNVSRTITLSDEENK